MAKQHKHWSSVSFGKMQIKANEARLSDTSLQEEDRQHKGHSVSSVGSKQRFLFPTCPWVHHPLLPFIPCQPWSWPELRCSHSLLGGLRHLKGVLFLTAAAVAGEELREGYQAPEAQHHPSSLTVHSQAVHAFSA